MFFIQHNDTLCKLNEYTVNPHYSWISYLQILLLAKFICNPRSNTHSTSMVICRHEELCKF